MRENPPKPESGSIPARPAAGLVAGLAILLACACSFAENLPAPGPGDFRISLDKKSPFSSDAEFSKRFRWGKSPPYEIASESFSLHVPGNYGPGLKFGLLVWISPTAEGGPLLDYKGPLAANRMVWAGANDAGNSRYSAARSGLALDAAHALVPHLEIDPRRVYIAGYSGGGRASSRLALAYSDVFAGGIFICGANYVKKIPIAAQPGFVTPDFPKPPDNLFRKAMKESSLVLVTGENDFNVHQITTVFEEGFKKDKFAHALCFVIPGMGHDLPDGEWMGRLIRNLEAPLEESAGESFKKAEKSLAAGKCGEALDLFEKAARHGFRQEFGAQAELEAAALREKLAVLESELSALLDSGDAEKAAAAAKRIVSLFGSRAGAKTREIAAAKKSGG